MSLRRVALRRHSDHLVAETAEEALACLAAAQVEPLSLSRPDVAVDVRREASAASNASEAGEEKDQVLPPVPDLNQGATSATDASD